MARKQKSQSPDTAAILKWLEKSTAKEDSRPVLTFAYTDGKQTVSSNGYSLFVYAGTLDTAHTDGLISFKHSADHTDGLKFYDTDAVLRGFSINYAVNLNAGDLRRAVDTALIFAKDNNDTVDLTFAPGLAALFVYGKSHETGDVQTAVKLAAPNWHASARYHIRLNGKFILNALSIYADTEDVTFYFDASDKICGLGNGLFKAYLMPMCPRDRRTDNPDIDESLVDALRFPYLPPKRHTFNAPKVKRAKHNGEVIDIENGALIYGELITAEQRAAQLIDTAAPPFNITAVYHDGKLGLKWTGIRTTNGAVVDGDTLTLYTEGTKTVYTFAQPLNLRLLAAHLLPLLKTRAITVYRAATPSRPRAVASV